MFDWAIANKERERLTIKTALCKHIKRVAPDNYETLSARAGIPVRRLKSYGAGAANPTYADLIRLMEALPVEFAEDAIRPAGLGGVSKLSNDTPDDMRLLALMNGASLEIADAYAEKGRVCHIRRPRIVERLTAAYRIIGASLRRHSQVQP